LVEIQRGLLIHIADWLKPGGYLLYATCSLEPQEGERQIEEFLAKRPDFAIAPIDISTLPEHISPTKAGFVRTLPGMLSEAGGLDGFFIAKLVRE
jgi:16S rRNA (cytosine967-C5)-methyltransferase